MRVLQERGIKEMSQAKVATEVGIRQSHLTYYFPKKSDLIAGILQQHIDSTAQTLEAMARGEKGADIEAALEMLTSNRPRMRFFLGLIVEADKHEELKNLVAAHIRQFDTLVAHHFGRKPGDPDVQAFLSALRGYGMTNMVASNRKKTLNIRSLAKKFGLRAVK